MVAQASTQRIRLSVTLRSLELLVSDEEMVLRAATQAVVAPTAERGYRKLYLQSVTQADQGVDFDFLRPAVMRGTVPGADT